jgi:hypothetical protein
MLLPTFKRDGTPVATPVHVAVEGERAYFRTWNPAGKRKRLRHTQRVLIAPCTMRGRSSSPPGEATARFLSGAEAAHAARALARKYPILHGLLIPRGTCSRSRRHCRAHWPAAKVSTGMGTFG